METITRKYTKNKAEGKITVKHFLNTKLKPVFNDKSLKDGKDRFAIYVRMMVVGQTLDIKSKIKFPVSVDEFETVLRNNFDLFNREVLRITEIIRKHRPFESKRFSLNDVSTSYNNLTISLNVAIENCLINEIKKLLQSLNKYDGEILKENIDFLIDPITTYPSKEFYEKYPIVNISLMRTLNWDSEAEDLINTLRFLSPIRGFEKFEELYKKYIHLWQFNKNYNSTLHEQFIDVEPTPIDWFETNLIQMKLKKINSYNADSIIEQITELLSIYKP